MARPSQARSRVYGVDFSGAQNAGRKIWVAVGLVQGGKLQLEECIRSDELPGSGTDRDGCLQALRRYIANHPDGIFGLDFPFGLPSQVVDRLYGGATWDGFLKSFSARHPRSNASSRPGSDASATRFQGDCLTSVGGRELRRKTDVDQHAPFSPFNLRLFRQTYHGIRDVLCPLVEGGSASVLPMQPPLPNRAWLVEICPASTLKQLGLYGLPYKGTTTAHAAARQGILTQMANQKVEFASIALQKALRDQNGDALDSVVAAVAVFRSLCAPAFPLATHLADSAADYQIEGFIYA